MVPLARGRCLPRIGTIAEKNEMSTVRDHFRRNLDGLTGALENLCNPERLQQRPEYRKRPTEGWLTIILAGLQEGRDLLSRAATAEEPMTEGECRLTELARTARECADRNLPWVREQLRRELEARVQQYHSAYWIEAIRGGMPDEFWFVLSRRDDIEAHLRARELLHDALQPAPELVRRVEETDALLREVGPKLWGIDPPSGTMDAERELSHPRPRWWWWLDQAARDGDLPA
jgi:hypothetical protein